MKLPLFLETIPLSQKMLNFITQNGNTEKKESFIKRFNHAYKTDTNPSNQRELLEVAEIFLNHQYFFHNFVNQEQPFSPVSVITVNLATMEANMPLIIANYEKLKAFDLLRNSVKSTVIPPTPKPSFQLGELDSAFAPSPEVQPTPIEEVKPEPVTPVAETNLKLPNEAVKVIQYSRAYIDPKLSVSQKNVILSLKFTQLYESANRRNKTFELTHSIVASLLTRKYCYYTGIEFMETSGNLDARFGRSIDRVDPKLGYVPGNVVACCVFVNTFKENILESKNNPLRMNFKHLKQMVKQLEKEGFSND